MNIASIWSHILTKRRLSLAAGIVLIVLAAVAMVYVQNDMHKDHLDPKIPFQVYRPPPAPDYAHADSWYLNPAIADYFADPRKVDVFFIHATSFNGGKQWLGAISDPVASDEVTRIQLPNYAAPFAIMGNIYAPKYRQASLYAQLVLREDARDARKFAYRDVAAAFLRFIKTRKGGRGFVIVGVEQGGLLGEKLLRDVIAPNPELKSQLVAAYFLETLVPQSQFNDQDGNFGPCLTRNQTGCVFSYRSNESDRPDKALQIMQKAVYWQDSETLESFGSEKPICVNPLSGIASEASVDARHSLGATNATGLEWGTEPAIIARKVAAHCLGGILYVDKPKSSSFNDDGTWEEQRKVNSYNLFYSDLQADIQARWQNFQASAPQSETSN